MEHGICRLCLKEADLLDSHYLPKRVYAMNRAKTLKNPNPVTLSKGQAKQISDQLHGPTYCAECEDRLNKRGERWVLAHLPNDYNQPFSLQEALIRLCQNSSVTISTYMKAVVWRLSTWSS